MRTMITERKIYDGQEVVDTRRWVSKMKDDVVPFNENMPFYKTYRVIPKFTKDNYLGYFYKLVPYLQKNTNILIHKKRLMYVVMNKEALAEAIGVSVKTVTRFLSEAKKNGSIIGLKTTSGYGYVVNPVYANNSREINTFLYLIFESDRKFVESLTKKQILLYNELTGTNYFENIKEIFPDIYDKLMK